MTSMKNQGFTLLEVMVVLVIISLMIGMATLSVGNNELKQTAEQEGMRFIARFDKYRNDAVFLNKDIGLAMNGQEIEILEFVDVLDPEVIQGKEIEEISQIQKTHGYHQKVQKNLKGCRKVSSIASSWMGKNWFFLN